MISAMTVLRAPQPSRDTGGSPPRTWPVRTRVAVAAARSAVWAARRMGRSASVIGGRVAGALDHDALAGTARGRTVVLVTGTNGKTTTTSMIARALGRDGDADAEVASNHQGANMPDGILSALIEAPRARLAVIEVDESYLPEVAAATDPAVICLLNFSRDQLDRVGEVRNVARRVGRAVAEHPDAVTVALADDVLCVGAADRAGHPVWISAPASWRGDAAVCPRCDGAVMHTADSWVCSVCGLAPPTPDWTVDGDGVRAADGTRVALRLSLPGRANRQNAAFAIAVAGALGVAAEEAAARLDTLEVVGGRYRVIERDGVRIRLLLAKNPAGWEQVFDVLGEGGPRTVVVGINSREADGRDVSWLWDVDFSPLARHTVVAAGDRVEAISVRLAYAGVAHRRAGDPSTAALAEHGEVDLVGNYTAFSDAHRILP